MYFRVFVLLCLVLAFSAEMAVAKGDKGDCGGQGDYCKYKDQCCKGMYCDKYKKKCMKYKGGYD
ncbi:uncharacterized protein DEA37_0007444, partial [Paragonimus westermani]